MKTVFKNYLLDKILLLILALMVLSLLLPLWGFYIAIRPPKIISDFEPGLFGLKYESVSFRTIDGLRLAGWFIPRIGGESDKTIIFLHGYPADKGDILPAMSFLAEDYNLFLFDFRYMGQSEGRISTLGDRERLDLLAAIEYLKTRELSEFGLWGFSMGAAVALMTASDVPEIKAVVADSSYAELSLMARELYRLPFLDVWFGRLTGLWARIFLGVNIRDISPAGLASELSVPTLIIHSKADEVIPFAQALIIKAELQDNPHVEFWFREIDPHGSLTGQYEEKIRWFFANNL